jgi:hypothetical protein
MDTENLFIHENNWRTCARTHRRGWRSPCAEAEDRNEADTLIIHYGTEKEAVAVRGGRSRRRECAIRDNARESAPPQAPFPQNGQAHALFPKGGTRLIRDNVPLPLIDRTSSCRCHAA